MKTLFLLFAFFLLGLNYSAQAQFSGGSGTASDPYQIKTAQDLDDIRNYLGEGYDDTHFKLMNNIDLTEFLKNKAQGWEPIGLYKTDYEFMGHVHGSGYTIKGLFIDRTGETDNQIGLFGYTEEASFDHLSIEIASKGIKGNDDTGSLVGSCEYTQFSFCSVTGGKVTGRERTGGLVGYFYYSSIEDSYAKVDIEGKNVIGGLLGSLFQESTAKRCYATGSVKASESNAGGLIGSSAGDFEESVSHCYATGNVNAMMHNAGGLIGECYSVNVSYCFASGGVYGKLSGGGLFGDLNDESTVTHCYTTGDVKSKEPGGFTSIHGYGYITICYSSGQVTAEEGGYYPGGFVSRNSSSKIEKSYYNTTTSGQVKAIGENAYDEGSVVNGLNETQMRQQSSFSGWFSGGTEWINWEGNSYPYFNWQSAPAVFTKLNIIGTGIQGVLRNPADKIVFYNDQAQVIGSIDHPDPKLWRFVSASLNPGDRIHVEVYEAGKAVSYKTMVAAEKIITTGIEDVTATSLRVFPNPVQDMLTVSTDQSSLREIQVSDINGRIIQQMKVNTTSHSLPVSGWVDGIYFIRITTDAGSSVRKIVKN